MKIMTPLNCDISLKNLLEWCILVGIYFSTTHSEDHPFVMMNFTTCKVSDLSLYK